MVNEPLPWARLVSRETFEPGVFLTVPGELAKTAAHLEWKCRWKRDTM